MRRNVFSRRGPLRFTRCRCWRFRMRYKKKRAKKSSTTKKKMGKFPLFLAFVLLQNSVTDQYDDGILRVLSTFFVRRHVQTVTSDTCWPHGKYDRPPSSIFTTVYRGTKTKSFVNVTCLRRRWRKTFKSTLVQRHISVFRSVGTTNARHVVQTRLFSWFVL